MNKSPLWSFISDINSDKSLLFFHTYKATNLCFQQWTQRMLRGSITHLRKCHKYLLSELAARLLSNIFKDYVGSKKDVMLRVGAPNNLHLLFCFIHIIFRDPSYFSWPLRIGHNAFDTVSLDILLSSCNIKIASRHSSDRTCIKKGYKRERLRKC